jgi:lipopolysaccharide export system protein LptC
VLRWIAVILAIVLVAVIAIAVAAYRKNQRAKLTPDD